jgi:carboxyl-terminal processing protease
MRLARVLAAGLLIAACTAAGDETTTTTTTTPSTTVTATVDGPNGDRLVQMPACPDAPEELAFFCRAIEVIEANYVDAVDRTALARAAAEGLAALPDGDTDEPLVCPLPSEEFRPACEVAGTIGLDNVTTAEALLSTLMAGALDPNSGYLDPEAVSRLEQEETGQIEGIGALVSAEDDTIAGDNKQCSVISETCRIIIVGTFEGAPAREAGLLPDDIIVGVNGESISGWSLEEVTARVRGPAGTPVNLTIERGSARFDVQIVRAAITIPAIESEIIDGVGYVKLYSFSNRADEQFEEAVLGLLGGGVRHLIVDLRDNPGGFLDTAIGVASVFLPDGEVVITQGPGTRIPYQVTGTAVVPSNVKVDVVVNRASASASEVVSGVLQERGRATVFGENTFGKNTVQQRFDLPNGGALRLTIARWVTPGDHDFGGVGIVPDVRLELDQSTGPAEVVAAVLAAS